MGGMDDLRRLRNENRALGETNEMFGGIITNMIEHGNLLKEYRISSMRQRSDREKIAAELREARAALDMTTREKTELKKKLESLTTDLDCPDPTTAPPSMPPPGS